MRFRSTACGKSFHCRAISRICLGRKPLSWALSRCGTGCCHWCHSAHCLGWRPTAGSDHAARSWWCRLGDGAVGVVVDATREILRVNPDIIEPAPALLTRGDGDAEITSICRLEAGQRLVALLSPDRLFRSELVRRILAEQAECGRN